MKTNLKLTLVSLSLCFASFKGYSVENNCALSLQNSIEKTHEVKDNKDYLGDYTYKQGKQEMTMSISEDQNALTLKISTEPSTVYNLKPVKDKKDQFDVHYGTDIVAEVKFVRADNKVNALTFTQTGKSYKWKKK